MQKIFWIGTTIGFVLLAIGFGFWIAYPESTLDGRWLFSGMAVSGITWGITLLYGCQDRRSPETHDRQR